MILKPEETTIAYRCPECGGWVTGMAGIFTLSADMLRLKCPCGGSEMTVDYTKEKKLHMRVPCFFCPQPHSYTLSSKVFFSEDGFVLCCPYSGIDVCFIGDGKSVSCNIEEADNVLREIVGESGLDSLKAQKQDYSLVLDDPQILEIVNFVIRDLDETGNITCKCPPDEGCYSVDITEDGILVTCENCGAKTVVPVTSTLTAQAFLNCDKLELV